MIDRQRGKIVFECDACGDVLETEESEFDEANAVRRDACWIARKIDDEWVHFCSSEKCDRA
jgi:hypothetical protein